MNCTCQYCGQPFSQADINAALNGESPTIRCKSCGEISIVSKERSSRLDDGFKYLASSEFSKAHDEFAYIVNARDAKKGQGAYHDLALACLGFMLAQLNVEVDFKEDDERRMGMPKLTCRYHRNIRISGSTNFNDAKNYLEKLTKNLYEYESDRFNKIAQTVDEINQCYEEIEKNKPKDFTYGAFILYEDEGEKNSVNSGYMNARKVKLALSRVLGKEIFLPVKGDSDNDCRYEAEILYALDHSECMIVMIDDDPDTRLKRWYQRYFSIHGDSDSRLGFVLFSEQRIPPMLPNNKSARNVYGIEEEKTFTDFVCRCNKIIKKEPATSTPPTPPLPPEPGGGEPPLPPLPDGEFAFGKYPQTQESDPQVNEFFNQKIPDEGNDNGWQPLFADRKGSVYAWYRDEEFKGKKYRGIYFRRGRKTFSVQASDHAGDIQRKNNYNPQHVYVFSFSPIIWKKIAEEANDCVVCVPNQAIESREFDSNKGLAVWEESSIRAWLNGEFLATAFTPDERQYLYEQFESRDRVTFLDPDEAAAYCMANGGNVCGSDYMLCIGGKCEGSIDSFWISASPDDAKRAKVVSPSNPKPKRAAWRYADATFVSVLPKIIFNAEELRALENDD